MTTIQVAQRSASRTILAFPASADCTSRIMRWMELSSPTLVGFHLKGAELVDRTAGYRVPGRFVDRKGLPGHDRLVDGGLPAAGSRRPPGCVSPGSTRSTSPTCYLLAQGRSAPSHPVSHTGAVLGRQVDQLFDARPGPGHRQILQQARPAA